MPLSAHATVKPIPCLHATLEVPGDKSLSHRALIFNAIGEGRCRVTNLATGADVRSTAACLRALGARLETEGPGAVIVGGRGLGGLVEPEDVLDAGNSGTTARLLLGLLAGQPFFTTLTGDGSLRRRPMGRVLGPLCQMGARADGRQRGKLLPVCIRGGNLRAIEYRTPVASAQLKSALLLAALHAEGVSAITEPAASRDHTERLFRAQGVALSVEGTCITLRGGQQPRCVDVEVPGDISSAAFWLVAGALRPGWQVTVRAVGVNPTRAGVLTALRRMGARVELANQRESGGEPLADVTVTGQGLQPFELSGDIIPLLLDEVPVLTVAACLAQGRSEIRDAAELRVKESDRLAATAAELRKMGARIEERPDGLVVDGPVALRGATVSSYDDHRLAMALAIAGLAASGETVIEGATCVDVSYPGFWEQLRVVSGEP